MARRELLTGTVSPVLGSTGVWSPRVLPLLGRLALEPEDSFAPPFLSAAAGDLLAPVLLLVLLDALAAFFLGLGSSALAKTGLGAPNFKRTGLSPQISSKL